MGPNGVVNGGRGIWNATNRNWTLEDGSENNVWQRTGIAFFAGASGMVDVVGTQRADGLTFLTDGYLLQNGTLAIDGSILVGEGLTATISSVLAGGDYAGIAKTGAGTLILSGNNTYGGGTELLQGILGVGHNNALGTGALIMATGTTLRAVVGGLTLGNNVTLNGAATIDTQSFALTLSGIVSGMGALTKTGSGDLILTGDNTYTGNTVVSAGTLRVAGTGRLGQGNYAGGIALNGGALRYSSSADQTLSGVISGSGSVTKDGADSVLTLTGNNTYTGGTLLQQGVIGVGHNNALGTGALTMEANTTLRAVIGNLNLANAITLNGAATVDTQAFAMTLSGLMDGTGALTKTGAGTLTLTGDNSYTGGTFLREGVLGVGHSNALGTGALSMDANTTLRAVIGNLNLANAITLNGAATVDTQAFGMTLSGLMDGAGALTKTGAGTLTLTGDNSYTGGTFLREGVLGVGHINALGTGALGMDANTTLLAAANNLNLANAITLNGAGTIDTQANTLTLSNTLNGASGELGKTGSGTLILTNTTTLSAVDVQAGTLDNRGALSASTTMSLLGDNTTLLNAAGASITVQGGAGTITGGAGAQLVDNAGSISGAVNLGGGNDSYILRASGTQTGNVDGGSGSNQLQIETAANATRSLGAGAFTSFQTIDLNRDATSTGRLIITSGLALDAGPSGGSLTLHRGAMQLQSASSEIRAGTVTIAQDARLSGIGLVTTGSGATEGLIVNGTIAPGNSIGTLNVAGRFTQNGTYEVEFRAPSPGVAPVRGVDNDLIKVTGSAVIANGAVVRLFPLSTTAAYDAALTAPNNPTPNKLRYTIIETGGGISNGTVSLLGFSGATTEQVGNDLQLVLSSSAVGGGGTGILVNQAPSQLGLVLPQDPMFGCRGSMFGRSGGFNEALTEDACSWADAFALRGGIKGVNGEGAAP